MAGIEDLAERLFAMALWLGGTGSEVGNSDSVWGGVRRSAIGRDTTAALRSCIYKKTGSRR